MERRGFLAGLAASGLLSATANAWQQAIAGEPATEQLGANNVSKLPLRTKLGKRQGHMLYNQLGSTGAEVSAIGLGGSHDAKQGVLKPRRFASSSRRSMEA